METRGRPSLPVGLARCQVTTTIPQPVLENIKAHGWKINELIADGIEHRETCKGLYEKIVRLQKLLEEKTQECEELRMNV